MKSVLKIVSYLALALIIVPPLLYLFSTIDKSLMKRLMILGTVAWFISVPFWMGKKD